jgi:hypothetical protein
VLLIGLVDGWIDPSVFILIFKKNNVFFFLVNSQLYQIFSPVRRMVEVEMMETILLTPPFEFSSNMHKSEVGKLKTMLVGWYETEQKQTSSHVTDLIREHDPFSDNFLEFVMLPEWQYQTPITADSSYSLFTLRYMIRYVPEFMTLVYQTFAEMYRHDVWKPTDADKLNAVIKNSLFFFESLMSTHKCLASDLMYYFSLMLLPAHYIKLDSYAFFSIYPFQDLLDVIHIPFREDIRIKDALGVWERGGCSDWRRIVRDENVATRFGPSPRAPILYSDTLELTIPLVTRLDRLYLLLRICSHFRSLRLVVEHHPNDNLNPVGEEIVNIISSSSYFTMLRIEFVTKPHMPPCTNYRVEFPYKHEWSAKLSILSLVNTPPICYTLLSSRLRKVAASMPNTAPLPPLLILEVVTSRKKKYNLLPMIQSEHLIIQNIFITANVIKELKPHHLHYRNLCYPHLVSIKYNKKMSGVTRQLYNKAMNVAKFRAVKGPQVKNYLQYSTIHQPTSPRAQHIETIQLPVNSKTVHMFMTNDRTQQHNNDSSGMGGGGGGGGGFCNG